MAGPWEQYQQPQTAPPAAQAGPWTQYQPPQQAPQGQQGQQPPAGEQPLAWSDVPGQALSNAGGSLYNFGAAMVQPVIHPLDTLQNVGDLAAGSLRHGARAALPEWAVKALEAGDSPEVIARQMQMASGVKNFYADRYGSEEGFKKALATDPIGVLADAATVLTGGGAAVTKLGTVAKVSGAARTAAALEKTGNVLSKAGNVLNPLTPIGKAATGAKTVAGKTAAALLGLTSGTGGDTVKEAYKAGRRGGEQSAAFTRNMRGKEDQAVVLGEARDAVQNIKQARDIQYDTDMAVVKADPKVIDFTPIARKYHEVERSLQRGGHSTASTETMNKLQDIKGVLQEWQNDPAMHTAYGLDGLKQRIDQLMPGKLEAGNAGRVVTEMYNAVKDQIVQSSPAYKKAMENYEKSIRQQKEIEKTLSLSKGKSDDTALRKLQSLTRNNANSNFSARVNAARELEASGAQTMFPSLAGQSFNTATPRGLAANAAQVGAYVNPATLWGLPAASPRIVGETAHAAGIAGRYGAKVPLPSKAQALLAQRLIEASQGGPR